MGRQPDQIDDDRQRQDAGEFGHRVEPYGRADGIADIVSGAFDRRRKTTVRALGMMAVAVMLRWRRWRSASELSVEPIRILFTSSFRLSPRPNGNSFGFRRIARQG